MACFKYFFFIFSSCMFYLCYLSRGENVTLGLLMPLENSNSIGKKIAGAIELAIDRVNSMSTLTAIREHGINFNYKFGDTNCSAGRGLLTMVQMYNDHHINAFIGGYCDNFCGPGGLLAAEWGVPMISYGCASMEMSDKQVYPTFARTLAPFIKTSTFFVEILTHFHWTSVSILYGEQHIWHLTANSFKKDFEANGISVTTTYQVAEQSSDSNLTPADALQAGKDDVRVFILCVYSDMVGTIAMAAREVGLHNGEYVFLSIEANTGDESISTDSGSAPVDHSGHSRRRKRETPNRWRKRRETMMSGMNMSNDTNMTMSHDTNMKILPHANMKILPHANMMDNKDHFIGLLDVAMYEPLDNQEYMQFRNAVRLATISPPFSHHLSDSNEVHVAAALLYDAVLLYALALNKTLAEDGNVSHVIDNIFNWEFQGIEGEVMIDHSGDRELNYALRNYQGGEFLVVARYFQKSGKVQFLDGQSILWPGGGTVTPLGRPVCGWDNEYCQNVMSDLTNTIMGIVIGLFVIICIIAGIFLRFRCKRREAELASMIWKINYEELQISSNSPASSLSSRISLRSVVSTNTLKSKSHGSSIITSEQTFCQKAEFRGGVVCVKPVCKDQVVLTPSVLEELNEVRKLNHQSLNQFIGACVDIKHVMTVMPYCHKGSLQDVLESDQITLDAIFKLSFTVDIAKGMEYIHKSAIQVHGRLRSSKVLVDNRWQCKISDMGLFQFRSGVKRDEGEFAKYRKKLWTAPEHLRYPSPGYSQKGDVYSYGIILQEIALESGPYDDMDYEPREIVDKVGRGSIPPFRPKFSPKACSPWMYDLMRDCWTEDPEDRPSFTNIIAIIRKVNGGKQTNIVDNMIQMMEKYATRLEEIVEERTKQLVQEQKKTENLLCRMLPKMVADELKAGRTVTPEYFEGVTIYFSDIVGFTALSSESTPMQVVNFLNDLYTCFDTILESYDAYKVETIGDAYMVVSGLPERNGDRHAGEIASMSLDLLVAVGTLKIRHKPGHILKLRIGMHTGSCVAGVVGVKMPRYCLFGDTVNYASRMESNGLPLKIHLSPECRNTLVQLGGYHLVERGEVTLKGKGRIISYFLEGRDGFTKTLPTLE